MTDPLLTVENLHTQFQTYDDVVRAVDGVSFTVDEGEIVGIVGESGSGKSVTALSLMRLEDPGRITDGSIRFRDTELTTADDLTIRRIRGRGMSMVFQDPMTTLNPVFPVGEQIVESLKIHEKPETQRLTDYLRIPLLHDRDDWKAKRRRVVELMGEVGIPNPQERLDDYPHELSGGMRQRAMLAIALASEPDLLIADEPTTALDVTIQAQILSIIADLNEEFNTSVLLISHDLGVVSELCDRIVVMYAGEVMEVGSTEKVLTNPEHPYTRAMLQCMPQNVPPKEPLNTIEGQVPDKRADSEGCPFAARCEYTAERCKTGKIETFDVDIGHTVQCCELSRVREECESTIGVPRSDGGAGSSPEDIGNSSTPDRSGCER